MCYQRFTKEAKKLRVAEQDITCWKHLTRDLKSTVVGFQYKLGKEYSGFGKFINLVLAKLFNWDSINHGYNSYVNEPYCGMNYHTSFDMNVKCTIPKGSLYYMNDAYYVSNRLRIDGIRQKDGTYSTANPHEMSKEVADHIDQFLKS